MNINKEIEDLRNLFQTHSDSRKAVQMENYMKNNFPFFGLQAPLRRTIQTNWLRSQKGLKLEQKWELIFELWKQNEREFQLTAVDWLMTWNKNDWELDDHRKLEQLITTKSWWDTVDLLASNCVSVYICLFFENNKNTFISNWKNSNNVWLQRTCLLFQLKYKSNVDIQLLNELIAAFHQNKDFFIQKAIGWSLRELSKTFPNQTNEIIAKYSLEGLAKREALKWISKHNIQLG